MTYDAVNRLKTKAHSNGNPGVTYTYDAYDTATGAPACSHGGTTAKGMLVKMTDGAGAGYHCYDRRGREELTRRTVEGAAPYDILRTFDGFESACVYRLFPTATSSHTARRRRATSRASRRTSTGQGTAYEAQTLASGAVPAPFGGLASLLLGNGVTTSYSPATLASARIRSRAGPSGQPGVAAGSHLTYDEASNVKTVTDSTGTPETATYGYDDLNRLKIATGFAGGASPHTRTTRSAT